MEEARSKIIEILETSFDFGDFDVASAVVVTTAPAEMMVEGEQADFSTNVAMRVCKVLGIAPVEVANTIVSGLNALGFKAAVAGPGFVNIISPDEYFYQIIDKYSGVDFEKNISCGEYNGKKVICEFSDPNPFKVLHVGHLYTSMIGESMSRLIEFAGGEVVRANFGGDVGLHVAKTIWALLRQDFSGLSIDQISEAYVLGTRAYEDDEKAKAEIVALNKRIYEIAGNDIHGDEVADLYWKGRELSYQYFEDFYNSIGIKFDKYYPESTVSARGLAKVREGLENGIYEESEGAVVYTKGPHTRVFINREGLPTYEAKDVGLIFTKWDDYHFDESVVVTGNDVIEYMKVVLASIAEMAPELSARTRHITHGNVRLPGNEKMSSRKGNFIKAVDVLDSVRELTSDEKVAMAAIKYTFLKYKVGGNIEFDAKESVSVTGNSGPYLQYATVRAFKILGKADSSNSSSEGRYLDEAEGSNRSSSDRSGPLGQVLCPSEEDSQPSALEDFGPSEEEDLQDSALSQHEKALLRKVGEYRGVMAEAVRELAPHKVCAYLFELAQEFSRFYENVKVAGSEEEAIRMKMVAAYKNVMVHGLSILGIEVPEEM